MSAKRTEDIMHELGCLAVEVDALAREMAAGKLPEYALHAIIFTASAPMDPTDNTVRFLSTRHRFARDSTIIERFLAAYWKEPDLTLRIITEVRKRQASMTIIQRALLAEKIRTGRGPFPGPVPLTNEKIAESIGVIVTGDAVKKERQRMRKRSVQAHAAQTPSPPKREPVDESWVLDSIDYEKLKSLGAHGDTKGGQK